jgi:hypothetical protein
MRARTLRADFGPDVGHALHSPVESVLATEVAEGHAEGHAEGRIGVRLPAF